MRIFRSAVLALVPALLAAAPPAWAQQFPSKPLRFIVPFPSGFSDALARMTAQKVAEALGQPVVIDNRPGGSGQIGAQETVRAPADGHTLFLGHIGTHSVNAHLFDKLSYDPERDFIPVTLLASVPSLLVVNPLLPVKSVKELVAHARANPGRLSYGTPGSGSSAHLAGELLKSQAKLFIVHIPYRGTAPALQDVIGGRLDLIFDTLAQAAPHAKTGRVRALAVGSLKRQAILPEVPTMDESGFPGWQTGPWFGVMVRSGTAETIVKRLNEEFTRALASPEVRNLLVTQGADPVGNTPEQFAAFMRSETARWGKVVKEMGIRAD